MSEEKAGLENPPPYTAPYGGGGANPPQGMPHPAQGQGVAYPPQQPGMGYAPQQQGMGYAPQQQGVGYAPQQPGMSYAPQQPGMGYAPQQQGMAYAPQPQHMQTNTTAVIVNQPGAAGYVIQQPCPQNYMVSSILACLCCFWPTGLFAIYYASRSSSLAAEGDMVGATHMANNARNLMITSIIIGIIWISFLIVVRSIEYANYSNNYSNSY